MNQKLKETIILVVIPTLAIIFLAWYYLFGGDKILFQFSHPTIYREMQQQQFEQQYEKMR